MTFPAHLPVPSELSSPWRDRTRRAVRGLLTAVALAASAGAASGQAEPEAPLDLREQARISTCEVISVAPGEPGAEWAVVDGLRPDRRQRRRFAWVDGRGTALLLLEPGAPRTLRVEARASREGLGLAASVGGVELGPQALGRSWGEVAWELPAAALGDGPELVTLTAPAVRTAKGGQTVGVAVASIAVDPLRGGGACAVPARILERPPPADSVGMPPGAWLVASAGVGAADRLELAFRGAWPATRLDLYCAGPAGVVELGSRTAGRAGGRQAAGVVELPQGCAGEARLAIAARGPGWANVDTARAAAASFWSRRRVDRLELAGGAALAVVLALGLARAGLRPPFARRAPWLDVAFVVALAAALRFLLFDFYPYAGFAADEGDYINGALALARDPSLFWSDSSWHAWQTWVRPPGYYLFLAGVFGPLGGDRDTVLVIQGVLSSLAAGATYLVAYPLFGRGAALAAGALFATYVGSIATFTRVLAEPLYMALVLPALAALAYACRRPSWRLALASGALFAVAALVRPAPVQFVPMAAVLLLVVHGLRRGARPAAALVLATAALLAPWYVRSARIHGFWAGLETVSAANLLQFHPDDRFVPHSDLDLTDREQSVEYYGRVKKANAGGELERRRGEITRAVLAARLADPGGSLERFAANAARFFGPLPDSYLRWILSDESVYRVGRLTDLRNLQHVAILLLGGVGVAVHLRDRRTWPLLTWWGFNFAVVTLFVQPSVRYRLGILPVLMVFAGWTIARVLAWAARPRAPRTAVAAA